jgi:CRISPR-associated endonuclease/helicase Cas3
MEEHPIDHTAISPKPDAPVLLPAHLHLLSQTAPVPAADPDISLYLHGPGRAADSVTVVWRADIRPELDARRLLLLVPPRAAEATELPIWAVRRWLTGDAVDLSTLADIPALSSEEGRSRQNNKNQKVFRWAGDDERSAWVNPTHVRPGDTIIVPAKYSGVDEYGWNPSPNYTKPAKDVAEAAAAPFEGRHFVVRVAPGLLGENGDAEALAKTIAANGAANEKELRNVIKAILSSKELTEALNKLDRARGKVQPYLDVYGEDENGNPQGVVFVAPLGLKGIKEERSNSPDTTEDDISGSLPGFSLSLQQHCLDVEDMSNRLAALAGLPEERIADLKLAGYLHDSGKADARFQEWLCYGDPLGFDPGGLEEILAKSARPLPREARGHSGLPDKWRHEALSVRFAPSIPRFAEASDQELVLWLIGTHHGHGRPLFPHSDPDDDKKRDLLPNVLGIPSTLPPGYGPQSLAYDWNGLDWCGLYDRLKTRYGVWELARMEAILRLADHRASEKEQNMALKEQDKNQ